MGRVMAVTFERHGQLHYLDPGDESYAIGDWVLYPTDAGPEVAQVVWAPEPVHDPHLVAALPRCLGVADRAALDRDQAMRTRRAQARAVTTRLAREQGLRLKVLAVDVVDSADDPHIVIYYRAPERVDFRGLVGPLARALESRVDLRHVGGREAARLTGGIGNCGRELCCSTFLKNLEPVAMRLAKDQNLPANPLQISGQCGRLMCCLKYEHPLYVDFAATAPAIGEQVSTPEGDGVVVGHSVPTDSVTVKRSDGSTTRCPLASVCTSHQARAERSRQLDEES